MVDGIFTTDTAVWPETKGKEVLPVHKVLLAFFAEAIRVECVGVREPLQDHPPNLAQAWRDWGRKMFN